MLIWFLIIISIMIFIPFFFYLGKEWYGPYSVFCLPFFACYIIAAINADKWGFTLGVGTFWILLIGEIAFLLGCMFAKKIRFFNGSSKEKKMLFRIVGDNRITSSRLVVIIILEFLFFAWYLFLVYQWGVRNGCSIIEAINLIMLNAKFNGTVAGLNLPFILQICLEMNYIVGYFFAYLLARRILLKDKSNIILLILGYIICIFTNFLGGSRGPILEVLAALLISFGITYFFKTNRKIFSKRLIIRVVLLVIIVAIGFFKILPMMGREQTSKNESDVFTQYIGSQIYNLNYFIENGATKSSFFCGETLKNLYSDIESFLGISIDFRDSEKRSMFVYTETGHEMGNVYTTYYNFFADFGYFGVYVFSFFIGWFSQKFFKTLNFQDNILNIKLICYIYMSSSIMFSFFSSRFFQNVIRLKVLIMMFWLILVCLYITENSIFSFKIRHTHILKINNRRT